MTVPDWVQDSVFYQIFPDRFANGEPSNDPPNVQPWGARPTIHGFQGGDLRGVIQRFDYLLDLGVTALYFNPIFQATSNHRYNTSDYYRIDPKLGRREDFNELLAVAHRHGLRVILDGVFNHCGRGFFAFQDLLENQTHSPYRDWYHIRRFPLDAYGEGRAENYAAWWGFRSLPKFNTSNPQVRSFLLGVGRYWVEAGADGWRLDVPNEIDDDEFWAEFRETVRSANPDAYLVGEIWDVNPRWVGPRNFDGLMNYPLRNSLLGWVAEASLSTTALATSIESLLTAYPRPHAFASYLPLGSHDTERIRTLCAGDVRKVRLMALIQFGLPGAPAIYYGDEIGMEGGKDPDSRRAFPWSESKWDRGLRDYYKGLIRLRRRLEPLRRGEYLRLLADDGAGVYAFARRTEAQAAVIVANASESTRQVEIPVSGLGWADGTSTVDEMHGARRLVSAGAVRLRLPPRDGTILTPRSAASRA
ncbi:MAG: hypothetical protein A2Y93_05970 [Chloroflexi bacterium RBG_13_68_17]|nr:MAG: hypothetical protein A2Y93_05970 [Chloroflexi bacterium RBG_13_68_17]